MNDFTCFWGHHINKNNNNYSYKKELQCKIKQANTNQWLQDCYYCCWCNNWIRAEIDIDTITQHTHRRRKRKKKPFTFMSAKTEQILLCACVICVSGNRIGGDKINLYVYNSRVFAEKNNQGVLLMILWHDDECVAAKLYVFNLNKL
ncbi:hypothetical protein PPL_04802 [Heterostelium album PN500]|uniref:Uncharacterized protein n=1 Tax=Heterostelium pallidum (strain ATCC 26659 / Pp 5 / PN500) TaxID=670386 RepID=D3B8K9_HETP5|nr:hypothetical protein PPL_04802 [Heterostelium album PN500]EFA82377.1 hypothetical protein PPL_04802 [Heterostelium album PN500]|eukprot:XP_020434494.1 hypothetical protein PPL_04802 [Heterostelium album PN500]